MKVAQVVPNLADRDAIGDNVLLWHDALSSIGVPSEIFSDSVTSPLARMAKPVAALPSWGATHVVYHCSTYSRLVDTVLGLKGVKRILIYHNITPADYFKGFSDIHYRYCQRGREQLATCRNRFDLSVADSEFNAAELRAIGYSKVVVLPLALPQVIGWLSNAKNIDLGKDVLNMLYVGRVCPNKRLLDLVLALDYIKTFAMRNARLIVIGAWEGFEKYKSMLDGIIGEMQMPDVEFVGSVEDQTRDALYRHASVFVTASEHEGFCVPVLEAWDAGLPVVAVSGSALGDTVGDAGVLVPSGSPGLLAEAVLSVWSDDDLRFDLQRRGRARLARFGVDVFVAGVARILEDVDEPRS